MFRSDITGDIAGDITGARVGDITDFFDGVSPHLYVETMTREQKPATFLLRMSPQLRDALRAAADEAGCSLNAYAVQVLAAAAGDPARFRAPVAEAPNRRELERDARGFPLDWKERARHLSARNHFLETMSARMPDSECFALIRKYDREDPGYFVEWREKTGPA